MKSNTSAIEVAINKHIFTPLSAAILSSCPLSAPSELLIYAVLAMNYNNNSTMTPTKSIHCSSVMYTTNSGHEITKIGIPVNGTDSTYRVYKVIP